MRLPDAIVWQACQSWCPHPQPGAWVPSRQREARITPQTFPLRKLGSLSAVTSAFTWSKAVSGLCLMPSLKIWMIFSLKPDVRG